MTPPFAHAGEWAAALSSLLWALGAVVYTRLPLHATPSAINLGKNLYAALCFAVLSVATTGSPWPVGLAPEPLLWLVLSGALGLGVCDSFLLRAFRTIGPRRVNVVMALSPAVVAAVAFLPPLEERPGVRTLLGVAVAVGGIALAVLESTGGVDDRSRRASGTRDAVIGALLHAVSMVMVRYALRGGEVAVLAAATVRLTAGAATVAAVGAVRGRLGAWTSAVARPPVLPRLVLAATLGTVLGIGASQAGLAWARHVGVAATLNAMTPIYLIPLSALFLGERVDARAVLSTLLAVSGIALMTT